MSTNAMPKLKSGNETKSQLVAVRVPAKLRHGLDVIARANGVSTTDAVLLAIRHYLESKVIRTATATSDTVDKLDAVADITWANTEAGRFLRMASSFPILLNDRENELLFKILEDSSLHESDGMLITGVPISEAKLAMRWDELQ